LDSTYLLPVTLRHFRFSRYWIFRSWSSGLWHCRISKCRRTFDPENGGSKVLPNTTHKTATWRLRL